MFEIYVIWEGIKPASITVNWGGKFETYVILGGTKPDLSKSDLGCEFEIYVILEGTKPFPGANRKICRLRSL